MNRKTIELIAFGLLTVVVLGAAKFLSDADKANRYIESDAMVRQATLLVMDSYGRTHEHFLEGCRNGCGYGLGKTEGLNSCIQICEERAGGYYESDYAKRAGNLSQGVGG